MFAHDCDTLGWKESQVENGGEKMGRLWENKLCANYVLICENAFSCVVVAMKFEKQVVSGVQKKALLQ